MIEIKIQSQIKTKTEKKTRNELSAKKMVIFLNETKININEREGERKLMGNKTMESKEVIFNGKKKRIYLHHRCVCVCVYLVHTLTSNI